MVVNAPVSYLYVPDIPRIEFQKKQSVFSLTDLMPDTRSFLSSDKADLPTNLKIKHVLQSLYYSTTMFPHFMSLFCWHTTYCNPRSNRFFYSPVSICQHFSSQKRKQMGLLLTNRLHADRKLYRASCALSWRSVGFLVNC